MYKVVMKPFKDFTISKYEKLIDGEELDKIYNDKGSYYMYVKFKNRVQNAIKLLNLELRILIDNDFKKLREDVNEEVNKMNKQVNWTTNE